MFNFYTFEISQIDNKGDLFAIDPEPDKQRNYKTPLDCFGSFFATNSTLLLPVLKSRGSAREKEFSNENYKCDVIRGEEGVILLTIENNKVKHTIVNKKDKVNEHHPFCHILIDNRPGKQIIGIERHAAFDQNTDKVATILKMGMNHHLSNYHLTMSIALLKKKRADFWEIVDEVRIKFNDIVRQIRFDFNGKQEANEANQLITLINELARKSDSMGALILNAEGNGEIKLKEIYEDITNLANICLSSKCYDLTVKFKNFGIYRYGAEQLAQFGVDEQLLNSFASGVRQIGFEDGDNPYALIDWLDKLSELLQGYAKINIQQGRKACRRR